MKRTLVFSHHLPRRTEAAGVECLARVAVRIEDSARGLTARRAFPDLATLGQAASEFGAEALPLRLDQLLDDDDTAVGPLEVEVPAQVQSWLERRAPLTWSLLTERTHVALRDEAFRIARVDGRLEIDRRPAGALHSERLRCPLLELAASLSGGKVPSLSAMIKRKELVQEARLLLREVLRSRWVTRRLPPGIAWNADDSTYALRHSRGVRVREVQADEQPEVPGTFVLELVGHVQPFEIDIDPADDLPLDVIRGAMPWLLDLEQRDAELFLDRSGRRPG